MLVLVFNFHCYVKVSRNYEQPLCKSYQCKNQTGFSDVSSYVWGSKPVFANGATIVVTLLYYWSRC